MTASYKTPPNYIPRKQRHAKQSTKSKTSRNKVTLEKHHIIPNFLLRKFAIDPKQRKKRRTVWLFEKGVEPAEKYTKNVFVETNRYCFFGNDNIFERRLNTKETAFAQAVQKTIENPETIDTLRYTLIDFIRNLSFRGHLYSLFKIQAARSLKELEITTKKIIKQLGSDPPQESLNAMDSFKTELTVRMETWGLPGLEKITAKDLGHWDSLSSFKWKLKENSKGTFILGDTGVVGYSKANKCWGNLLSIRKGDLKFAVLPLSPKYVLLGYSCFAPITSAEINEGIASTSSFAFISSERSHAHKFLQTQIGKTSNLSFPEVKHLLHTRKNLHISKKRPKKAIITPIFSKDCSLSQNDRDLFTKLAMTFEQNAESLLLAKSLQVKCEFTDNASDTLKYAEEKGRNVKVMAHSSTPVWIYDVAVQPENRFRKRIKLNTILYNESEMRTSLRFEYFLMLFRLAYQTNDTKALHFLYEADVTLQKYKRQASYIHALFQNVDNGSDAPSCEKKDNLVSILERNVYLWLDKFTGPLLQHLKFDSENNIYTTKMPIKIIVGACTSLAEFFALATSKQRDEFLNELKQNNIFELIFADEWENLLQLCDEELPEAEMDSECIFRICDRCNIWCWLVVKDKGLHTFYCS